MATPSDEQLRSGKTISIVVARVVPILLTMIVAYVSYAVVGPLAVSHLINGKERHLGTAIAVVVVWFLLLIPVAIAWVRLLYVVIMDPGYIPRLDITVNDGDRLKTPGLEAYYEQEVFVCDQFGLPIWCRYCNNWKPDRAHHNQDVGRCTLKMDHFCPWVGGVVGERAYKFFLQFLLYSSFLSAYGMSLFAYYVSRDHTRVQWIIALALGAFFVFFTLGMVVNSIWMTFRNVTTIENLDIKPSGRSMYIAVLLPLGHMESQWTPSSLVETKQSSRGSDDTGEDKLGSDGAFDSDIDHSSWTQGPKSALGYKQPRPPPWQHTISFPLALPADKPPLPAPTQRTFAVLELPPGLNPWDLGNPWQNFKEVMGERVFDWLLPIRHSPCCDHSTRISQYPLGSRFEQHLIDIDFPTTPQKYSAYVNTATVISTPSRARRKRMLDEGWQNGERPNGWWTQKEARRVRNQERRQGDDYGRHWPSGG